MKRHIFFIVLDILTHSQTVSMDTLIKCRDTLYSCSMFDNIKIEYISKHRISYVRISSNHCIDTIKINLWRSAPAVFNHKIYFNTDIKGDNFYKKFVYSVPDRKKQNYDYTFKWDQGTNQPYTINETNTKLFLFNPDTKEKIQFVDFEDIIQSVIGTSDTDAYFEEIFFINKECAHVGIGYDDGSRGDGYSSFQNFLACTSGHKTDITDKLLPKVENNEELTNYYYQINFVSGDRKYIQQTCYYTTKSIRGGRVSCLFDDRFNYISDLLLFCPTIGGINIQQGEVQNYFLTSRTDSERVIIPYRFNPALEPAMYQVYSNTALAKKDINGLGKYELNILRNMVFAKYNYGFSSEFYQAYFNLYEFYRKDEMRQSRVKDVNDKLTVEDKANIQLIKDMENKRGK